MVYSLDQGLMDFPSDLWFEVATHLTASQCALLISCTKNPKIIFADHINELLNIYLKRSKLKKYCSGWKPLANDTEQFSLHLSTVFYFLDDNLSKRVRKRERRFLPCLARACYQYPPIYYEFIKSKLENPSILVKGLASLAITDIEQRINVEDRLNYLKIILHKGPISCKSRVTKHLSEFVYDFQQKYVDMDNLEVLIKSPLVKIKDPYLLECLPILCSSLGVISCIEDSYEYYIPHVGWYCYGKKGLRPELGMKDVPNNFTVPEAAIEKYRNIMKMLFVKYLEHKPDFWSRFRYYINRFIMICPELLDEYLKEQNISGQMMIEALKDMLRNLGTRESKILVIGRYIATTTLLDEDQKMELKRLASESQTLW